MASPVFESVMQHGTWKPYWRTTFFLIINPKTHCSVLHKKSWTETHGFYLEDPMGTGDPRMSPYQTSGTTNLQEVHSWKLVALCFVYVCACTLACVWTYFFLFLKIKLIYFTLCVGISHAWMRCIPCICRCPRRSEEGIRSPGTECMNIGKTLCGCWESQPGPL